MNFQRPSNIPKHAASKMVALVERGAPRDFRDIHAVCHAGLATPARCWELWRQRPTLTGSDTDTGRATLALQIHLERIALHRPLAQIVDPHDRASVACADDISALF